MKIASVLIQVFFWILVICFCAGLAIGGIAFIFLMAKKLAPFVVGIGFVIGVIAMIGNMVGPQKPS